MNKQKVYILITTDFNDDSYNTRILGVYDTKEKARQELEEDYADATENSFITSIPDYELVFTKELDYFSMSCTLDNRYIETHIEEREIL